MKDNNGSSETAEDQCAIPPWLSESSFQQSIQDTSSCCYCSCSGSTKEPISPTRDNTDNLSVLSAENLAPSAALEIFEGNKCEARDADRLRKKKQHAIKELLQTEKDYVEDLTFLVQVCLEALSRQQWIPQQHKSTIMRNSYQILSFHKQLLSSIESTTTNVYNSDNHSVIASTFLDQIAQFSLYKHYCNMHAEAWTLTSEYRARAEWADFLKDCMLVQARLSPPGIASDFFNRQSEQKQSYYEQQKKLHFEDYLIKPVQRICRYQLLIKGIRNYTAPQTTEYDLWTVLFERMQDIVKEIDEFKYEREMKERTERFIQRLNGDWRLTKNHVIGLGNILISGAIEVTYSAVGQTFSRPKYLGCFVFSTYMILVKPKKLNYYEPKYWFPLYSATFEDLEDIEGQREYSFVVQCKKHAFIFSATCSNEKQLWVKKLTQIISDCKSINANEALLRDTIISSLPGISNGINRPNIRVSKSFTDLLDKATASNPLTENETLDDTTAKRKNSSKIASPLKRSISTYMKFDDTYRANSSRSLFTSPTRPDSRLSSAQVSLKKRYSVDYHPSVSNKRSDGFALKPRNNSDLYIRRSTMDPGIIKRRPSSLDLLSSTATNTTNLLIGKMPWQTRSNYQDALRLSVDHKLRDVCTQDYLSSKAWYLKDRELLAAAEPPITPQSDISNNNTSVSNHLPSMTNEPLKKRKSTSFIRSSASSFSLMMPKRASDFRQSSQRTHQLIASDFDDLSHISSAYSNTDDKNLAPAINGHHSLSSDGNVNFEKQPKPNFIVRRPHTGHVLLTGTAQPTGSDDTLMSSNYNMSFAKKDTSKGKLLVAKVLRRLSSFHQKSTSPLSFDSQLLLNEERGMSAILDLEKSSNLKWKSQEYLTRSKISDRPLSPVSGQNEEEAISRDSNDPLTKFSYVSTLSSMSNINKAAGKSKKEAKWRNRLSMLRPATLFKMRNSNPQPLDY